MKRPMKDRGSITRLRSHWPERSTLTDMIHMSKLRAELIAVSRCRLGNEKSFYHPLGFGGRVDLALAIHWNRG